MKEILIACAVVSGVGLLAGIMLTVFSKLFAVPVDETAEKIKRMYAANKFKLEIIDIPGPDFSFASDVFRAGIYS